MNATSAQPFGCDGRRYRCRSIANGIRCDRENGHSGQHRGYIEQYDDVVFWADDVPFIAHGDEVPSEVVAAYTPSLPDVGTEAVTHHIPSFTRHKDVQGAVYEEACCGKFVGWSACAPAETEPTCRGCREWLGLDTTDTDRSSR